jgi:hypothetical protein
MNIDQQITVKRMSQLKLFIKFIMWSVFSNAKHTFLKHEKKGLFNLTNSWSRNFQNAAVCMIVSFVITLRITNMNKNIWGQKLQVHYC